MEDNQGSIPTPQLPQPADSLLYCEMPVPVAVMQAVPLSTLAPFAEQMPENMEPGGKEEQVLPFVQKLRDLEQSAKAEMAAWDPAFSQVAENGAATVVSTKRKASEMSTDPSDDDDDDDDEVDDDDDGEVEVPPLDPHSQKRPKLPIYHPGFKLTEDLTLESLSVFVEFFQQAKKDGYKDDELSHLWNEVMRSKNIPYQDAVKLAVAGDTGAGKSALMNAILGVINLTIESDSGGACTCVITEFRQSPSTQIAPFAAEVQFFCLEMSRKLVKDLFTRWFVVKQKQRQNPEDVDDQDLSQMATSRDCLKQLFADRLEFHSAETFMSTATSANDPKVLNQLMKWTTDIHRMFVADGEQSVHFSSSTPEDLTEQYHPFTRECPNASYHGKPLRFTPWPLVQIVRVTLSSPILEQNVIIADIPGGADVNYFRVDNAARYLQQCDMTIVVGKIDRLQDNIGFRTQYMDAFRRRRSGSVILVATRSDDLNDEGGSTLVLDATTAETLDDIAQKIADAEKKIRVHINDMDRFRIENGKISKQLKVEKKRLLAKKIALEKKRKNERIAYRSKKVAQIIAENYRADTGDDASPPIYCVSNRMYMRHLRGYDGDNPDSVPTMSIEDTQIPALCSLIYSLPSKGRTASLDHFTKVSMQTLLNVMQMSCSTTTEARVKHLTAVVEAARKAISSKIEDLAAQFRNSDIKTLEDELADHSLQTRFDKHAMKCLSSWEDLKPATHRAIVNKKGHYAQKKSKIFMNWNEDLMSFVRPNIDHAFRRLLDTSVEKFMAEAAQTIKEELRDLNYVLRNDPKALAGDAYKVCFFDNLKRNELEVTRLVDNAGKSLLAQLTKVHTNAYMVRKDDYFPTAIEDYYDTAYKIPAHKGSTMHIARCAYLQTAIPGPTGPFSYLSGWVEEDSSKIMDSVSKTLQKDVDGILMRVQNAFDRMKTKKENDTMQGKQFRMELHQLVAEARRITDGVTQDSLEACKQYK